MVESILVLRLWL